MAGFQLSTEDGTRGRYLLLEFGAPLLRSSEAVDEHVDRSAALDDFGYLHGIPLSESKAYGIATDRTNQDLAEMAIEEYLRELKVSADQLRKVKVRLSESTNPVHPWFIRALASAREEVVELACGCGSTATAAVPGVRRRRRSA
jgi:hypothetical protein